jgi:hypothetical protein
VEGRFLLLFLFWRMCRLRRRQKRRRIIVYVLVRCGFLSVTFLLPDVSDMADGSLILLVKGPPLPPPKLFYKLPYLTPEVIGGFFPMSPLNTSVVQRTWSLLECAREGQFTLFHALPLGSNYSLFPLAHHGLQKTRPHTRSHMGPNLNIKNLW